MGINGKSRDDRDKEAYIDSPDGGIDRRVSDAQVRTLLEDSAKLDQIHKTDNATGSVYYDGYNQISGALDSDSTWKISRTIRSGQITTTEYANNGNYTAVWDDRAAIFAGGGYGNTLSLNFDGVNDNLNGGDIHQFDIATAFSISMWVKPNNLAATRILFAKAGSTPNVYGYMLRHNATTGDLFMQMRATGANRSHTFDVSLTAGIWQQVVFTYAGGSNINGCSAYVNAVKNTSSPSGALSGTMLEGQDFTVGQRNNTFFYSGHIDEVHVFDKELSPTEVTEIYNTGSPFNLTESSIAVNILSTYRMGDGDIFPTITDQTNADDLTMVNMASDDIVMDVP